VNFHAGPWPVHRAGGRRGEGGLPAPALCQRRVRTHQAGRAGSYESGGATDNVIPIWKAVAPAIDMVSPDNYSGTSRPM